MLQKSGGHRLRRNVTIELEVQAKIIIILSSGYVLNKTKNHIIRI